MAIDGIAEASRCFEARAVLYSDSAALIVDQAAILKCFGRMGNASTPHSQHARKELMGEAQLVAANPVMGH